MTERIAIGAEPWAKKCRELEKENTRMIKLLARVEPLVAGNLDHFDRLESENAGLNAENELQLDALKIAAAENARLRDALRHLAETHAWLAFGECRAFGTDTLLTSSEADKLARAALGGIMSLPPLPDLCTWSKTVLTREDMIQVRMREYGALCRKQALEEAAVICDVISTQHNDTYKHKPGPNAYDPHYQGLSMGADECSEAIKELIT